MEISMPEPDMTAVAARKGPPARATMQVVLELIKQAAETVK
jgi:hypothetical protein